MNQFKHNAIRELYSTVVTILETGDGVITAKDENENDVSINMTSVNTKATELENNQQTKKTSGKQKLLDLGLTEEEVKALIGV
jgi:diaminopimelate epimerase